MQGELRRVQNLLQETGNSRPLSTEQAQAAGLLPSDAGSGSGGGRDTSADLSGGPPEARRTTCEDFRNSWLRDTSAVKDVAVQRLQTGEIILWDRNNPFPPGASSPWNRREPDLTRRKNTGIDDNELFQCCDRLRQEMQAPGTLNDTELAFCRDLMVRAQSQTLSPLPGILLRFTRTPAIAAE